MALLVYKFGLLPPTTNADLVNEQMYLRHKYYNNSVALENEKRKELCAVDAQISPVIAALELEIEQIDNLIDSFKNEIGKKHSAAQSKITSKEDKDNLKKYKAQRKELFVKLKSLKIQLKDDPERKAKLTALIEQYKSKVNSLRKDSDLYWGTYLLVDDAIEAASKSVKQLSKSLRFKSWNGDGQIGVRSMPTTKYVGMNEVFDNNCSVLQIDPIDSEVYNLSRGERKRATRSMVRVRLGSIEGAKKPLFATFPIILHRPIPPNSRFKRASISRKIFASKVEWTIEITIEVNDALIHNDNQCVQKEKAVAIDIGWRKIEENLFRIITWRDTNNNVGFINLPKHICAKLQKVDDLKSIRSNNFNKAKEMLNEFIKNNKAILPEEFVKDCAYLSQWRAIAKLSRLIRKWAKNRFENDSEIYDILEKWRYHDFHLWNWETNQRRSVLRERKEFYRKLASELNKKYENVVMEDFNLAEKVARKPSVESNENDNETARANRFKAAPSTFRLAIDLCFKGVIIKINPVNTSKIHYACGSLENIGSDLIHTCSCCEKIYDRDDNATFNILKLGLLEIEDNCEIPQL